MRRLDGRIKTCIQTLRNGSSYEMSSSLGEISACYSTFWCARSLRSHAKSSAFYAATSIPRHYRHAFYNTFNPSISSFRGLSPLLPLYPNAGSPASFRARTNGSTTVFIFARNSCLEQIPCNQYHNDKRVRPKWPGTQTLDEPVKRSEVLDPLFKPCNLASKAHDSFLVVRNSRSDR